VLTKINSKDKLLIYSFSKVLKTNKFYSSVIKKTGMKSNPF